jgi:formamidopyrimidine-DNA glycosylase
MPELPEVETMRRGIAAVAGCTIATAQRLPCPRKPIAIQPGFAAFRRRVEGARIERTDRAGKRVVLWLDSGDALVFEPRMTGLVLLADPPDPLYNRLRLSLAPCATGVSPVRGAEKRRPSLPSARGAAADKRPTQLLYWVRRGLGSVRLLTAQQFADRYGLHALGPDALVMTADLYRQRLGRSSRPVKVALLDQKAVAGIGNLYASEILHVAGVHPARACRLLSRAQWAAIAAAASNVLETAIRYEGSTLSDGTYRNALNGAGGYQNEHRVYDKAGERCQRRRCGGAIERIVQAQRSTFFCPQCQKRRCQKPT